MKNTSKKRLPLKSKQKISLKKIVLNTKKKTKKQPIKKKTLNQQKLSIKYKKYMKHMKGGKFIGVGSFGCVLSPNIKCNKKTDSNKKNLSKLITYRSYDINELEDIYDEINIGKKIKSIDKDNNYLSPIISYCVLKHKKKNKRTDIKLNYVDDEDALNEEIEILLSHKENNVKKCLINVNKYLIIINLILSDSGIDLTTLFSNNTKYKNEIGILKNNYIFSIKHVLNGLELLQKHKIVHKDIKLDNLCLSINNNLPIIKYIDFGLSNNLKYISKSLDEIYYSGTPCYSPPDYIILIELKKQKYNELINNKYLYFNVIKKLLLSIKSNFSTFTNKGLNKSYLCGNLSTYNIFSNTSSISLNDKKINYFININDIKIIMNFLLNLYQNNELIDYYFTNKIGLLSKIDIFSTGLVIFEITKILEINDILVVNLIKNMLELNSINRYNIDDCINHILFN